MKLLGIRCAGALEASRRWQQVLQVLEQMGSMADVRTGLGGEGVA